MATTDVHPNSKLGQSTRRKATVKEVEEYAKELKPEFLSCRSLGHNWTPHTAWKSGREYIGRFRCLSCGSHKNRIVNARGEIQGADYDYADGYTGGINTVTYDGRAALRWTHFVRTFGDNIQNGPPE
jgi:hypothetical protein